MQDGSCMLPAGDPCESGGCQEDNLLLALLSSMPISNVSSDIAPLSCGQGLAARLLILLAVLQLTTKNPS